MTPCQIGDLKSLQAGLTGPQFLLFKHSHRCGTSDRAFRQYEKFLADQADFPTGWINVVEQRDWSAEVERVTGIVHESPQALWIRDGRVAWHASHWEITADALEKAVTS